MKRSKAKCIGILTSGGDCPGLNAAIRGVAKAAKNHYGMEIVGVLDGFTGLVENRVIKMTDSDMTDLLTRGGTILGTGRNKPHRMPGADGKKHDMTGAAVETYRRLGLDCLVCIGGDGTAKNAMRLMTKGVNVVTLPKTIDNDIVETDTTFGYDSAVAIATEAIDRLHTTASSHHRIILVDIMGHNAGWLALAASLAGGSDVCLIPEIPYRFNAVVDALKRRRDRGSRFSLVSVAEGAVAVRKINKDNKRRRKADKKRSVRAVSSAELAPLLSEALGIDARVTSLGHVQRGGIPTPTDRLLATQLGTAAARLIAQGKFGIMVAVKGNDMVPVALEKVAGQKKTIPLDHPMIQTARLINLCLGDE